MDSYAKANALLTGRTIKRVRMLSKDEAEQFMWWKTGPVIELDDGTLLVAQSDNEGNNAGAILVQAKQEKDDTLLFTDRV